MRLNLTDATLVAVIWNKAQERLERTVRVLNYMTHLAEFERVILFAACQPERKLIEGELIQIPVMDHIGWQTFQMRLIPEIIDSFYVMHVQDDGFILRPDLWTEEFMDFDFVGAPWADGLVGNDGFCIQSEEFMEAKRSMPFVETANGDEYLCRDNRSVLEAKGIRFAPTKLAAKFSTETYLCDQPSFGFHGKTHDPAKYNEGWKLIEEWEQSQ